MSTMQPAAITRPADPNDADVKMVRIDTINETRAACEALGFPVSPALFGIGDHVPGRTDVGWQTVRTAHDAGKGNADSVIDAAIDETASEARQDYLVGVSEMAMADDGALVTSAGSYRFERYGLGQFTAMLAGVMRKGDGAPNGMHGYMASIEPDLRAHNINRHLSDLGDCDTPLLLRTRINPDGERTIYAVASDSYVAYDPADILSDVRGWLRRSGAMDTAKVSVVYDGFQTAIDVAWMADHDVNMAGCGDVFSTGVAFETSEDKTRRFTGESYVLTNQCLNYIIVGKDIIDLGSRKHIGHKPMAESLREMLAKASATTGEVVKMWGLASEAHIEGKPEDVYKRIIGKGIGKVAGYKTAELVERYARGHAYMGGTSRAAYANGMTRAAHAEAWKGSAWTTREIEREASRVLTVRLAK